MASVQIKKSNKVNEVDDLNSMSKEDLIHKIRALQAHNLQLKNVISKSGTSDKSGMKAQKQFDFTKCTYRHILLKFFYLGWDYQGYVVQEDTTNTVEHHLFEALLKTCLIKERASSNYHRCGRTDKGVSSFGQVISINIRSKLTPETLDDVEKEIDYCKILNRVLPENIQCLAWCPVEETFSARFDCKSRTYKYFFPKSNLNIDKMKTASSQLLGTHDFRNLCKMDVGNGVVEFIRNIETIEIDLFEQGSEEVREYSMYVATIKGKAFLWHQIRCIMGILFLIGAEKEESQVISELLDINTNPRKPEYAMASEIPLNLFHCDYEINDKHSWIWDVEAIRTVQGRLKSMWTLFNVKATMIKSMLNELTEVCPKDERAEENELPCLIQGLKTKKYVPLMKRQKCESLDDKIKHFVKRSRLEIKQTTEKEED